MMTKTEPRHGTNKRYNRGCRLDCCRHAHMVYKKRNRMGATRQYVDPRGTIRRLEALSALGYSIAALSVELGFHHSYLRQIPKHKHIRSDNAANVSDLYDRLCMTLPDHPLAERSRRHARKQGWAPPLAWDDIDNDEKPDMAKTRDSTLIDDVKVRRVLDGIAQDCTTAERYAVLEQWDGSLAELARVTGWNVGRMVDARRAA